MASKFTIFATLLDFWLNIAFQIHANVDMASWTLNLILSKALTVAPPTFTKVINCTRNAEEIHNLHEEVGNVADQLMTRVRLELMPSPIHSLNAHDIAYKLYMSY